jgi:hypothetical protein
MEGVFVFVAKYAYCESQMTSNVYSKFHEMCRSIKTTIAEKIETSETKDDEIVVCLDPRTACYAQKMTSNYIEALSFFEDEIKRMAGIRDSSKS